MKKPMPKSRKILFFGIGLFIYFNYFTPFFACKSLFIKDDSDFALA